MVKKLIAGSALLTLSTVLVFAAKGKVTWKLATKPSVRCSKPKLALLTGTVSQTEVGYRAAQAVVNKYGSDCVLHNTYPDNFMQEQESTIGLIKGFAAAGVKGIVVDQGVPGTIAGIRKAKRINRNIVFGVYEPHEDINLTDKAADIILGMDNVTRGTSIVDNARRLGAKIFVHISFARHMSYVHLGNRWIGMQKHCKKIGFKCIFRSAIDPLSIEGGIAAAQQSIPPIVKAAIKEFKTKDIAFYSTNDAHAEPLIRTIAKLGAIYVEPDLPDPSPYLGALGIKIPRSKAGDFKYINRQISAKINKMGNGGRMANWPAPMGYVAIKSMAEMMWETNFNRDMLLNAPLLFSRYLKDNANGVPTKLNKLYGTRNFGLALMDSIVYGTKKKVRTKKRKSTPRKRRTKRTKPKLQV